MAPGAKISDYNKALNWDVDHVQVNGEAFSQSELENIEIHEDSVVKVFYQAKNTDYIGEASFYDYEVIPYDKAGQQRADLSINADSNYPSEQKDNRFTVGTVSQNLSENQYDTVTKKTGQNGTTDDQHINVYTGGTGENAKKTGIVTGLSDDYKEVLFSVNEPGVFPKDGAAAAGGLPGAGVHRHRDIQLGTRFENRRDAHRPFGGGVRRRRGYAPAAGQSGAPHRDGGFLPAAFPASEPLSPVPPVHAVRVRHGIAANAAEV